MKIKHFIITIIVSILFLVPTYCFATDNSISVDSEAVLLCDMDTGKVLYEKNRNEKMYPASTTKMLTAILTIENANLNDTIQVKESIVNAIPSGYSIAGLKGNEMVTVEQLLNVLLVHSANDAADVLGDYIGGSIPEFAEMMNKKAQEIGCTNSHFTNPSGKHDDDHYTTAEDLLKIAMYCMQNDTFKSIVAKTSYTLPATDISEERTFKNTNSLLNEDSKYYYPNAIGIKTGFTSEAKHCLVSASDNNGFKLLCVVLGGDRTKNNEDARFVDSKNLLSYGYNTFEPKTIVSPNTEVTSIDVVGATNSTKKLDLLSTEPLRLVLEKTASKIDITPEITLNSSIEAPIKKGTILGTASYTIDGKTYTQDIIASHDVEKDYTIIYFIIAGIIALIIIISIILIAKKRNNRYRF